jgi:hypothetical protein
MCFRPRMEVPPFALPAAVQAIDCGQRIQPFVSNRTSSIPGGEWLLMIAFVQPFGLHASGGGSRILRALMAGDHPPALSLHTGVVRAAPSQSIEEIHVPTRPSFGRLEWSRFHSPLRVLDGVFEPRFQNRLRRILREREVRALHIIPHGFEIVPVIPVAEELQIPWFLNVHDDLEYIASSHPLVSRMLPALSHAWRNAKGIFVISDEMGREYSRRYGAREYEIVTDGLTATAPGPLARPVRSLRVYFMGLFHLRYQPNLRALLDALKQLRQKHPDWDISMTLRCGKIFGKVESDDVAVTVLPFASEAEVAKDMLQADLLYQPLPFGAEAANFGKLSLSTKLVTYLGSGLPILYHGPADAAACTLLRSRDAGVTCTTLDPAQIARDIEESMARREAIVSNALRLAHERFMLADQQRRFWGPIRAALEQPALV